MSKHERGGLLHYWSIRYFLVVIASMAVVVAATLYAVYNSNIDRQYQSLGQLVRNIAQEAEKRGGTLPDGPELYDYLLRASDEVGLNRYSPILYLFDAEGRIVQHYPAVPPAEAVAIIPTLPPELYGGAKILRYESEAGTGGRTMLAALQPLGGADATGYVVYMMPLDNMLQPLIDIRFLRLSGGLTLAAVGWGIIYLMTRRLVKPIRSVVQAARQIVAGNYEVKLDTHERHPKEIDELMSSFAEMSDRLRRLEAMRSQLLAGVTHELKTPITSISGLVQAVRDGIVSGEEAKIFLDNSLRQTKRLHKMVEDLLDFNSFASNTMAVKKEKFDLRVLLKGTVKRWQYGREPHEADIAVEVTAEEQNWQILSDPERIEQIIVNLLNNARDEMTEGGQILIRLSGETGVVRIAVTDHGPGIPEERQADIFEPFYRGETKKHRVRGLGLGLPFSRLIARSLGGDLTLENSSGEGTTFTLMLPR